MLIRMIYDCSRQAGETVSVPVRGKYSFFFLPEPTQVRLQGQLFITKPNAVILAAPDEPRWYYFPKETRFHFFHARVAFRELLEKYDISCGQVYYPSDPEAITKLLWKLRVEYVTVNPYRADLQNALLQQIMICLSRQVHKNSNRPDVGSILENKVYRLRFRMLSNPERVWTVEDLAGEVSLSPSRFHVVYRSMFGISPIRDLIIARVDRAKVLLLENGSETLAQVAERLGYKNQYDFSRQFKQVAGISPGAYRKNNR